MASFTHLATKASTLAIMGLLLAGCTAAPTEQEQTMTPDESKQGLDQLMVETQRIMALNDEAWDADYVNIPGPCTLSNREQGINYVKDRFWRGTPDPDPTQLIETVQNYWESQGLATELDVLNGNPGDEPHYWLTGWGGPVKNIGITIIPGQVGLDGESICVVGEL